MMRQKTLKGLRLLVFIVAFFFFLDGHASAATYYLATNGNDSNSCATAQSSKSAKQTFFSAKSCLAPGDMLIVRDGTYVGSSNAFSGLPNGSAAGGYITIKAENEGAVIITGGLQMSQDDQYLIFQGLRFQNPSQKQVLGNHLKFLRNEFQGGSIGNSTTLAIGSNDFSPAVQFALFEDNWVHGMDGRYKVLVYNSSDIVIRRMVTRFDGNHDLGDGAPEADFSVYDSHNVLMQNNIAIDGITGSLANSYVAAFYNVCNGTGGLEVSNYAWRGSMAVFPTGYTMGSEGQCTITGQVMEDIVGLGGTYGVSQLKGNSAQYKRFTLIGSGGDGFGIFGGSASIQDSVIANHLGQAFNGTSGTNSVIYNNAGGNTGGNLLNPFTNGLLYPPRIESGSPLASGGVSGSQIGAEIVNRLGVAGTLYGETGYNTDTGQALWPFPNEARIKKEMCTDAGVTRGFCSDSSLTHYIMNYLGNGDPYSIPDTTPPTSPTNLAANATSQSSITVSWTAATDDIGVTNYQVERCTGLSCTTFANVGNPTASPFVDSGLTPSTGYSYHVRAVDAAGNTSGWSNVVGATTQAPDTQAPTAPSSLTTSTSSSSTIDLTWTASTDNVGVTEYKVERCSGSSCTTFSQIATPTTNSYQDTGLNSGTAYRYQVRATDAAGNNSSYSSIASATTQTAPITLGETSVLPSGDSGNGNLLLAQQATLSQPGTLQSLSFYVTTASGNLRLGVYDATGPSGGPGTLKAQTNSFTPTTGWNTQNVTTPTPLTAGTYWLAYLASSSSLAFVRDGTGSFKYYSYTFGALPTAFSTTPSSGTDHWSFYATLTNPSSSSSCNTVTTTNFSQAAYNSYGAPFDAFQTSTNLLDAKCTSSDTHTINLTAGITGDTTRIVYTKGYYYDPVTAGWTQYSGTCNGALNGEWCQGSISATITNPNISTASASNPTYLVGMTCSVQGGSWKCGCRDTTCSNFYWQVQGAGM